MPWISAGASIVGGLLGSSSASKAAKQQAAATREANALQRYIYDNNVRLNQPAIEAGNLGRNRLMELLGLGGTPGGQTQSREQLRQSLSGRFTTPGAMTMTQAPESRDEGGQGASFGGVRPPISFAQGPSTIDEVGLQAAIDAEMARSGINSEAPDYGSLMHDFTGADLQNEPGYQFGMAEGQKAIDRRAASGGGYFSGAALKAAQRFGQDYAGTKFNEAFNRDTSNKTNKFNRLTGLISPGQTAANQVGASGQNYAGAVGSNLTNNANAQGGAAIAQGNAWANTLNQLANQYTDYNARNRMSFDPSPPIYDYGRGGPQ